ncbi:MAG: T9SS type A sorting domain-containing protein [Paludibacteraceae bacterium]|nr:T9SS type A sorting domain-containing protein [Paludibacteraceae bacterium]
MKYSQSKLKYWISLFLISILSFASNAFAAGVTHTIESVEEWNDYATQMLTKSAMRSDNYVLIADLDFTGQPFLPFGGLTRSAGQYSFASSAAFSGTFDGQSHVIKNISNFTHGSMNKPPLGIFGASKGTIKFLVVDNMEIPQDKATIINANYVGGICAYQSGGSVENCAVINSTLFAGSGPLGGITGGDNGGTISNCAVYNTVFTNPGTLGTTVGGIVGQISAPTSVHDCYVNASFKNVQSNTGGIVGQIYYSNTTKTIVERCFAQGSFCFSTAGGSSSVSANGGIVGYARNLNMQNCGSTIDMSVNLVSFTGDKSLQKTAGAIGFADAVADIEGLEYCYATGKIAFSDKRGDNKMAGINAFVGQVTTDDKVVYKVPENCYSVEENYKALVSGDYVRSSGDRIYGAPATLKPQAFVQSGCLAKQLNDDFGATKVGDVYWGYSKTAFDGYPVPFAHEESAGVLALLRVKAGCITSDDVDAITTELPVCGGSVVPEQTIYHIKTAADLADFAKLMNAEEHDADWSANKTVIIDNDITGPVTTVIGSAAKPFKGTFQGDSYLINLAINSTANNVGLIGFADGKAKITDVQVKGSVRGASNVGGIVGNATAGVTISGCANGAVVNGTTHVGGVVGAAACPVSTCLNVANVTGTSNVGGIAGSGTSLTDCANMGYINGAVTTTAGVVGSATGTLTRCLNAGYTQGAGISNGGTIASSYFDFALSLNGQLQATSVTMAANKTLTIEGWTGEKGQYPVPSAFAATQLGKLAVEPIYFTNNNKANAIEDSIAAGANWKSSDAKVLTYNKGGFLLLKTGTVTLSVANDVATRNVPVNVLSEKRFSGGYGHFLAPYQISKLADLTELKTFVSNTHGAKGYMFELTNDITDGTCQAYIGSSVDHFKGHFFSTAGHVFNIDIDIAAKTDIPVGLFGVVDGIVENVSVTGSVEIAGTGKMAYAGGIAGYCEGRIAGCVNNADVTGIKGSKATLGGICGGVSGSIVNCTNIGRVSGNAYAAGITNVDDVSTAYVAQCFNGGVVTSANAAGVANVLSSLPSVKPTFVDNINVAAVNGSVSADALVYSNGAAPVVTGGLYDNQHAVAKTMNATAKADSSKALTLEKVTGFTTAAGVYPTNGASSINTLASLPVFAHVKDSANNIKHDFSVASAAGVVWTSTTGNVKVDGNKVERVKAGADTLVATLGNYNRRVPVVVACVWDTVNDPDLEVCNMYAGKTYTKDTTLVVKEISDNTNPNADCGTLHIKKVIITVGEMGRPIDTVGCGSLVYEGFTHKKDTVFTNKNCDIVNVKIYPLPSKADSVVTLDCNTESYTYNASNGKAYKVERTAKPIKDSLIVTDIIKSKTCGCDSLIRRVYVNIPTVKTDVVLDEVYCNTYDYTTFSGKVVTLGWPIANRDPEENYWQAKVQDVTYIDTNFVSGKEFSEIRVVKLKIFKSLYLTDTIQHVGVDCTPITIPLSDGREVTYSGIKDTVFYDQLMSEVYEGCPQSVTKIKLRLKGLSEVKDTVYIGNFGAPRCTDCDDVIVLENVQDGSLANFGFCDKVKYKQYASDSRVMTRTASAKNAINVDFGDEDICGYVVPFKFRINSSEIEESAISVCDSMAFETRDGRKFIVKNDTIISDTVVGAVPGCGCDSIYKTKITVFMPTRVSFDTVACNFAIFSYLDKAKASLTIKNDTVIVDTLKKVNMACDSIIRTSSYTIHKAYPEEVNQLKEFASCNEFVYESPLNGRVVCKRDTLFNDSLKTIYGCDSIVPVKVTINKPVVIDSVMHICSTYVYHYRKGGTITLPLGDNPALVDTFTIFDSFKNVDPTKCDTTFRMLVYSHTTRVRQSPVTPVCSFMEYERFNGERFEITESVTVYDTLKSQMCDCDSIVRIDSFSVGQPYYPTADTKLDTTLFGCRTNTVLTYERRTNAWNPARSISFVPVSSEFPNQPGFLNIVKSSNPSVVALDTVVEKIYGSNVRRFYWLAHDTMKTIAGCDSVVPFRVEYDGQHTLGRKYFYVNHKQAPFVYQGITYNMPSFANGVATYDSVEVVLPSRTGGCDTTYYAMVKMYPCKVVDTTVHYCDEAMFRNLHREWMTFTNDTVYSDTIRYVIKNDTASCDSMIQTWHIKIGHKTPANQISDVYVGGCDNVVFHREGAAFNMQATDTVFYESGIFRCRYINASGCDSVVPVRISVHKVEENTVVIRRTDYFIYKSPLDGSRTRVTRDTVIEERVPNMVTVNMSNGTSYTCDSVITTQITIRPAEWRDTTITGCDSVLAVAPADSIRGDIETMAQQWYKRDTTFDLPNSQTFDPYYHVHIKLNKSVYGKIVVDSCRQVTYKGSVYTTNTSFIERSTTVAGCDSVDTVYIVVHPVIEKMNTATGCGYLIYDSKVYSQDTTLYDTVRYTNGCNCDSIVTAIDVVIYEPTVVERAVDSCMFFTYPKMVAKEYNWFIRDSVYEPIALDSVYTNSVSFYRYAEEDRNGCNTIEHLTLNVNPCYPYPVIINKYNWILALNKDLLTKDVNASHITGYQWYKNGELLLGANQSYYTEDRPLEGCYQVQVKFGSMSVESENVCIDPSMDVALSYDLYPAPVSVGGMVSIKCNFDMEDTDVEIYNTLGVKVYHSTLTSVKDTPVQIPFRLAAAGNYFLKLTTEDGTVLGKKFIVK